jgi:hypothetical protein
MRTIRRQDFSREGRPRPVKAVREHEKKIFTIKPPHNENGTVDTQIAIYSADG